MALPVNCPKCGAVLAISETVDTNSGRVRQRTVACDTKGCGFSKSNETAKQKSITSAGAIPALMPS